MTTVNYAQAVLNRLNAASPGLEPDLAQLYALLAMTKGADTSLKDVHDAWALYRNQTKPDHKSLIPFDELAPEVQELDREYMAAIHEAALAVTR